MPRTSVDDTTNTQATANEQGEERVKHILHMRARKQNITVEDMPLDAQYALLGLGIAGIGLETDAVLSVDLEVELPNYPLRERDIERLNEKKRIHQYRAWYIVREENGVETTITPEQAARDAKAVAV